MNDVKTRLQVRKYGFGWVYTLKDGDRVVSSACYRLWETALMKGLTAQRHSSGQTLEDADREVACVNQICWRLRGHDGDHFSLDGRPLDAEGRYAA